MADESKHVSNNIVMLPEVFNHLRRELQQNWPTIWETPMQWKMMWEWQSFVEEMVFMFKHSDGGNFVLLYDTGKEVSLEYAAEQILNELRKRRGAR